MIRKMAVVNLHTIFQGVIRPSTTIILAASTVIMLMLIQSGIFGIAHGQANIRSITPQQKAAMCDPNNPKLKVVNMTESKICGIAVTIKRHTISSASTSTSSENNNNNNNNTSDTSPSILPLIVP